MKGLFFLPALGIAPMFFAQTAKDSIREIEEVRFVRRLPVTKEIINVEKDLGSKNLGQDLPVLLKNQTSVIATSDAGNGVGYTGLRIRGVDGTRINVMLNGVPYNDSESQGTFFVNVGDVTSSASALLIQRGVGTSTNGVAAFGASVNILTKEPAEEAYFSTQHSYGSFNTRKHAFEAATGKLLNDKLSFMGRYSIIKSDGYVDRAFSDLSSYMFTGVYSDGNTKLKFFTFGGDEKTYQSWNGISKTDYETNPRLNYSGAIYHADGSISYYDNETDNYRQDHYHLVWEQRFSDLWKLKTTLHYTDGKGYYENYKQDAKLSKYNLAPIVIGGQSISRMDLIRRKWLDNDFYGFVADLSGRAGAAALDIGLVGNQYYGRHFGEVARAQFMSDISGPYEFYRNHSLKNEVSGYAKALWSVDAWELYGDLQLRNIGYKAWTLQAAPEEAPSFDKKYTFFNPKAGLAYQAPFGEVYFSYALAQREPARNDLKESPEIKPEKLSDFELGLESRAGIFSWAANAYYMRYNNQLVLTGKINDVGAFLHENVGKSYRLGVELSGAARFSDRFDASANLSLSRNRNVDYIVTDDAGAVNLGNTPLVLSPDVIGNLSLTWRPLNAFSLSSVNKYVGAQYLDNTGDSELRLNPYFLSDIVASYSFEIKRKAVDFSLLLNNLLNKKYVTNGFVADGPYYFPQAGFNVMAGVNLKFK